MDLIEHRQQQVLCDKKWHKFNRRTWLFRYIPFVEIVFGSGSLAIGNVDNESDFDVLIGVRDGRIFTARFFSAVVIGLFGWRRTKKHGHAEATDKICLNHFVTRSTYKLRAPANLYWRVLYQSLVPVYGQAYKIQNFYDANAQLIGERKVDADHRYKHKKASELKNIIEFFLSGRLGDSLEEFLKKYQVSRIRQGAGGVASVSGSHRIMVYGVGEGAKIKLQPLITYSDEELDFHPDSAQIIIE